jgi:hypothetical protein
MQYLEVLSVLFRKVLNFSHELFLKLDTNKYFLAFILNCNFIIHLQTNNSI